MSIHWVQGIVFMAFVLGVLLGYVWAKMRGEKK